jgi:hypothetical protein
MSKFQIGQSIESHTCGQAIVKDIFVSASSSRVAVEVERVNDGAKVILAEDELLADVI